jgi:hypothetical protein
LRIDRRAICYGLGCSALCFLTVAPCFGQVAKQFVKVEPNQCWLDVQDAVHRRAYGVITDERLHTLTVDRFASIDGTIAIVVEVLADQNKKGEQGCSILGRTSSHSGSDWTRRRTTSGVLISVSSSYTAAGTKTFSNSCPRRCSCSIAIKYRRGVVLETAFIPKLYYRGLRRDAASDSAASRSRSASSIVDRGT